MSWIAHGRRDRAIHHALLTESCPARSTPRRPSPVTNQEFDAALGGSLDRPAPHSGSRAGAQVGAGGHAVRRPCWPAPGWSRLRLEQSGYASATPSCRRARACAGGLDPVFPPCLLHEAVVLLSGGLDFGHPAGHRPATTASTCTPSAFATASATPSSSRPRAAVAAAAGVAATSSSTSTCGPSAARRSPPTSPCPRTRLASTDIGDTHPRHLRAGPQHHLPVASPWPGPRCSAPRHLHRRQRPRLQRLPRLPARVHRGLRAHGQPGHPAPASRAAPASPIHTPLIDLTKAEIIRAGIALGVDYALTISCYDPRRRRRPACGRCDACLLRRKGFAEAGVADPDRATSDGRRPSAMTLRWSRRSSTPCRARAPTPGAPRCSAGSPAATCGAAARSTAPTAVCRFCDTDFVGTDGPGGGRFATAGDAGRGRRRPPGRPATRRRRPLVVCTGGEPLLQLDAPLVEALHDAGLRGRRRDQRHRRRRRRASTGSA